MMQEKSKELNLTHQELKFLNCEVGRIISESENFTTCKVMDNKHRIFCEISNKIHRSIMVIRKEEEEEEEVKK